MTSSFREGLLEEEMERREKHLVPIDKTEFGRDHVIERLQKHIINKLLEHKRLPFISAAYFNWRVDHRLWEVFGKLLYFASL